MSEATIGGFPDPKPKTEEIEPEIDDRDRGDSIATLYSNRVFIRTGVDVCRIAFGELVDPDGPTHWRAAITMTTPNLRAVGALIIELLGEVPSQPDDGDGNPT